MQGKYLSCGVREGRGEERQEGTQVDARHADAPLGVDEAVTEEPSDKRRVVQAAQLKTVQRTQSQEGGER